MNLYITKTWYHELFCEIESNIAEICSGFFYTACSVLMNCLWEIRELYTRIHCDTQRTIILPTAIIKASFPLQPYRIVTYRSIFFCVEVISSTLAVRKQRNTLRFGTIRLKWKTGLRQTCRGNGRVVSAIFPVDFTLQAKN
jgi:hypothetical protein